MTQQEIAAQRMRMFFMVIIGVAALIASYAVGYVTPHTSVSTMTEIVLTAIFLCCIFVAGRIALKLNKEKASH